MSQPRRPWPSRPGTASARADGPLATSWRQLWISPATTNTRTAACAAHRIALSTRRGRWLRWLHDKLRCGCGRSSAADLLKLLSSSSRCTDGEALAQVSGVRGTAVSGPQEAAHAASATACLPLELAAPTHCCPSVGTEVEAGAGGRRTVTLEHKDESYE